MSRRTPTLNSRIPISCHSRPLDSPPAPTELDRATARRGGTTVALEATRDRLQQAKSETQSTAAQQVVTLRQELDLALRENDTQRRLASLGKNLHDEMRYLHERLRMALIEYAQGCKDLQRERDSWEHHQ